MKGSRATTTKLWIFIVIGVITLIIINRGTFELTFSGIGLSLSLIIGALWLRTTLRQEMSTLYALGSSLAIVILVYSIGLLYGLN